MITAVIAGAGKGERMGNGIDKQFLELSGVPMLSYCLKAFEQAETIEKIVLVVSKNSIEKANKLAEELKITKLHETIAGGEERQDSVFFGLKACPAETDVVVIHDGARPLVTPDIIDNAVNALEGDGLVPGIGVKDTIKRVADGVVEETFNRNELIAAQTPQVFKYKTLLEAHNISRTFNLYLTDDAALLEKQKYRVKVIDGDNENIKVTTPEDLELAEILLKRRNN